MPVDVLPEAIIAKPRALVANLPAEPPNIDSRNIILIGIRGPLIAERLEKARDDLLANSL